jgi:hypothetical protein
VKKMRLAERGRERYKLLMYIEGARPTGSQRLHGHGVINENLTYTQVLMAVKERSRKE